MTREEQIMEYANSFEGKGVESDELKEIIRLAIIDGAKWADAHPKEPSLPSDLDEAAEEYGRNTFINECMKYGVCDGHDLSDAFKAGAEWMAGQGVTKETQVYANRWTDVDEVIVNLGRGEYGFKAGDKVIVQIRKKQ